LHSTIAPAPGEAQQRWERQARQERRERRERREHLERRAERARAASEEIIQALLMDYIASWGNNYGEVGNGRSAGIK